MNIKCWQSKIGSVSVQARATKDHIEAMKSFWEIFIFVLVIITSECSSFDDAKCDEQLRQFDAALEKREYWAQKCK